MTRIMDVKGPNGREKLLQESHLESIYRSEEQEAKFFLDQDAASGTCVGVVKRALVLSAMISVFSIPLCLLAHGRSLFFVCPVPSCRHACVRV